MVSFFVGGLPAPKGSAKAFYAKKMGRAVVTHDNARTKPWEAMVRAAALSSGSSLQEGPVEVRLTFVLPRPRGHFGTRGLRPSAPGNPTVKPDIDKLARAVLDALTGALFRDDAQVISLRAAKFYDVARDSSPRQAIGVRVELEVYGDG